MGWVERYVEWASSRSPLAPSEFHRAAALFVLSSVIGRRIFMQDGPAVIYPNVWPLLLGRSGETKKSTCQGFAEDLLMEVVSDNRMADSASPEGMIAELSEKSVNGSATVWTIIDEFGQVVSGIKHKEYMSDVKDMLMKLYDGKPIQRRLAKLSYQMDPVYMTLLTATTSNRLSQLLKPDDLEDGFFPRFLVVQGSTNGWRSRPEWTDVMAQQRQDLIDDLANLNLAYQNHITRMVFEPDAKTFYDLWCADIYERVKVGDFPGPVFSRLEDYFEKLCMLYEVSDSMSCLGPRHVIPYERAVFVEECIRPYMAGAVEMFERLGSDRHIERVYEVVRQGGALGVTYRELVRRSKLTTKRIAECLDTLTAAGRVVRVEEEYQTGAVRDRYRVGKP